MGSRMRPGQTACHRAHGDCARRYRARARPILARRPLGFGLPRGACGDCCDAPPSPANLAQFCAHAVAASSVDRKAKTDRPQALSLPPVAGAGGMDTIDEARARAHAADAAACEAILNVPSIFGFKSMLVKQPDFLNRSLLAVTWLRAIRRACACARPPLLHARPPARPPACPPFHPTIHLPVRPYPWPRRSLILSLAPQNRHARRQHIPSPR